jgi:hypothetical protein
MGDGFKCVAYRLVHHQVELLPLYISRLANIESLRIKLDGQA